MRIGILGTGTLARALGTGWVRAGHEVVIAGRSADKAHAVAADLAAAAGAPEGGPAAAGDGASGATAGTASGAAARGPAVRAAGLREAVAGRDAVLLAVAWDGVAGVLRAAGAGEGALAGTALIDPTNAVEHGVGVLLTGAESMAGRIAALAPGAHVVKAFHLFPSDQWTQPDAAPVTVAMCGDDPAALETVGALARDVGGTPAVVGGLDRARQLEEVAGFTIALFFAGHDPSAAIPRPAPNRAPGS